MTLGQLMPYTIVFEIAQKPFDWLPSVTCLLFIAVGLALINFGKWIGGGSNSKLVGWLLSIFGVGATLAVFALTYSTYREYVGAYKSGHYAVVEGLVEDFNPAAYEGHGEECFRVRQQRFCYSDSQISPAFNQSSAHGGPIRQELPVRIAYYVDAHLKNQILKLEIPGDWLAHKPEHMVRAEPSNEKRNQGFEESPFSDPLRLGLSFAVFLVSLCWNLDWQHYARYWVKHGPPYSRFWELVFRTFFLACLVGTCISLIILILERHRTFHDLEKAALYCLVATFFFVACDLIFRWRLRTRRQSSY